MYLPPLKNAICFSFQTFMSLSVKYFLKMFYNQMVNLKNGQILYILVKYRNQAVKLSTYKDKCIFIKILKITLLICYLGDFSSTLEVSDVMATGYAGDLFVATTTDDVTDISWTYNDQLPQYYEVNVTTGICTRLNNITDQYEVCLFLKIFF